MLDVAARGLRIGARLAAEFLAVALHGGFDASASLVFTHEFTSTRFRSKIVAAEGAKSASELSSSCFPLLRSNYCKQSYFQDPDGTESAAFPSGANPGSTGFRRRGKT
jgi:hypothetical protein